MEFLATLDPLAWLVILVPVAALAILFLTGVRSARHVVREEEADAEEADHR
jgi:hypothetical protein